jgi:uncharacterized lipoprotein NlpE involved in copper resistance
MRKKIMRMVLLAVLALAGCEDPPESGTVTEKTHKGAYSWVQMVCAAYNKGVCTVQVPVVHNVPESWGLCLRSQDKKGCREVPPETWSRYKVGEMYP